MQQAIRAGAARLEARGCTTPMLDARLLLLASAGVSAERYIGNPQARLTGEGARKFTGFLARREGGEPVSRILGKREFYGRDFVLGAATLDPRPDTETLIDAVLKNCRDLSSPRILDLGVGSGAILLTLLAEMPGATGVGVDRSFDALGTARANAAAFGMSHRASFCCGDWLAAVGGGEFDILVANPPYIARGEIVGLATEVYAHDPMLALDGGPDGLRAYVAILERLPAVVRSGAFVFFEVGDRQSDAVAALMEEAGLRLEEGAWLWRDLAGKPRCVAGKRQGARPAGLSSHGKKKLGTAAASG